MPADLYIAHYPAALPAAAIAARRHGALYAFDAEDFHLGDWPDEPAHQSKRRLGPRDRRASSARLRLCHRRVSRHRRRLCRGLWDRPPDGVLNVFPRAQAPPGPTPTGTVEPGPSVYWFSQTIGPDRGLECAVQAIGRARARPHLYLRGSPASGFLDRLQTIAAAAGAAGRLHILSPAAPSEMERLAAPCDVGFVGETGQTASRRIALTNKLFTYLLAGLPVVMSDIPAHRAFAPEAGDAARLYTTDDADSLAAALDSLLGDPALLAAARAAAFRLGQTRFNWDVERAKLLDKIVRCSASRTNGAQWCSARDAGQCGRYSTYCWIFEIGARSETGPSALLQPYYRVLEILFPNRSYRPGLLGGYCLRLHPRLLGMRPEPYEPTHEHSPVR